MVLGCQTKEPQGRTYACSCAFLTDTDKASAQHVTVCAPDPNAALERAASCAQSAAPATVEGCRCDHRPNDPCPVNGCAVADR